MVIEIGFDLAVYALYAAKLQSQWSAKTIFFFCGLIKGSEIGRHESSRVDLGWSF